jgi:uncharacterized protein involved in exopolysaccharide biosynthesis
MPVPTDINFDEIASTPAAVLESAESPQPLGLLDLLLILARQKTFVFSMTIVGIVVAAGAAWLLPTMYTATAVIMIPQQQQSSASLLIGQLGPLAGMAGRDLGLKNPVDLYLGLLNSRTIADGIVTSFKLQYVYRVETITEARKKLASRASFESGKDSLIRISVEDRDPGRAAEMANAYVRELHQQNDTLAISEASQRRLFFEKQLSAERSALADAEVALKESQQKTGVLQVGSQMEVAIGTMARMRAEIMAREVALRRLAAGATAQNPEVIREEMEIKELRSQLSTLEASEKHQRSGNPLISASSMPEAGLEYVRRLRQLKYHESLFELLAKQYETARIDESRESPVIQVVDQASRPEKKSGPPRLLIMIFGTILSLIAACALAIMRWRMRDPSQANKLTLLSQAILGRPANDIFAGQA